MKGAGSVRAAGPDYRILRVIGVLVFAACCAVFFFLVRRRVGPLLALGFTAVLLFLGSAWETLLWPLSELTFVVALAFGFGALLALERNDRIGDLAACALTTLAVVSHSTGIGFLAGVAVSVLWRDDRGRRAWIFLVPLAIYAAWWLWALRYHESLVHVGNLLVIAPFFADSVSAACAGITGLSPGFSGSGTANFSYTWGEPLALAALAAFAFRLARGRIPRSLWVALAILVVFWVGLTLSLGEGRVPTASRYVFPDVALVLLIASEALAGVRLRPVVVAVILVVLAVGILSNIRQLTDAAEKFRNYSPVARADLAAVEIARRTVSPDFDLNAVPGVQASLGENLPLRTGDYFVSVDRFGSYAFSAAELVRQPPPIREDADRVLAAAEGLSFAPAPRSPTHGNCQVVSSSDPFGTTTRRLPTGTSVLVAKAPTHVHVGRFSDGEPIALADLPAGDAVSLKIPRDGYSGPWRIALSGPAPVRMCTS